MGSMSIVVLASTEAHFELTLLLVLAEVEDDVEDQVSLSRIIPIGHGCGSTLIREFPRSPKFPRAPSIGFPAPPTVLFSARARVPPGI